MSKILKNTTGSALQITDVGVTIPVSPLYYVVPPQEYLVFAASSNLVTAIGNGNIIVNDGSFDLNISDGVDLMKGFDKCGCCQSSFLAPQYYFSTLTTANNTPTTIETIPTVSNTTYFVEAYVVGKLVSGSGTVGNAFSFIRQRTIKNIDGVLSIATDSEQTPYTYEDNDQDVIIGTSGTNIIVQVQGSTGNIILWKSEVRIVSI